MLVLSRKPGEKIQIGNSITVTIILVGPNTVRLGIDAPRDISIVRDDVVAKGGRIVEQNGTTTVVDVPAELISSAA